MDLTLKKHTLFGPRVKYDWLPGGRDMEVRRCAVIHFTAGATGKSSVEFWKSKAARGANAHLVIERDGSIIQCVKFNKTANHAGASRWLDPSPGGKLWRGLNECSIGIELANAGKDEPGSDAFDWAKRHPRFSSIRAPHRNGGKEMEWECYPPAQIATLNAVLALLCDTYRLDDITGHDCVAPERKDDPGPAFPMEEVRTRHGFQGLPAVNKG